MPGHRPSLCIVTATDITVRAFFLGHLRAASERYDVTVVTNTPTPRFLQQDHGIDVAVICIDIRRDISLVQDLRALFSLVRLFMARRFSIVHSVTPKAGLLAALAGCITRIPNRLHTFTGQVWVTRRGPSRWFLKTLDRIMAACLTRRLADSNSQRDFLIEQGVVSRESSSVLGSGSISGVDLGRFAPDSATRSQVRQELGLGGSSLICLFVGRLKRDKGVVELMWAFGQVARENQDAVLLFVGPDEEGLTGELLDLAGKFSSRTRFVPFTQHPERYMAAADLFCLPSRREGFGSVVIEAAAVGVPAVVSRIYGLTDAVVEGETGLLHDVDDVDDLAEKMGLLLADDLLRQTMGAKARQRAQREFSSQVVTQALLAEYKRAAG